MDIFLTWFTQFAFASGDSCTGWQVRKGTGFVPIEDLPSEDEEQDEEEAGFKHAPALFQTSNLDLLHGWHMESAEICHVFRDLEGLWVWNFNKVHWFGALMTGFQVGWGWTCGRHSSWNYRKNLKERGLVCCSRYVVSSFVRAAIFARQFTTFMSLWGTEGRDLWCVCTGMLWR